MTKEQILDIFRQTGVMLEGHFLLTSGRHSDRYMQCAKLFQYPEISEIFAKEIARRFDNVDLVVGPAVGGIILAYEVARQLKVPNIYAERENGVMTFRRGFSVPEGLNVLAVEDVVTTGGSVKEVIDIVNKLGARVVGVVCIVDRSDGKVDFGVPFEAVLSMEIKSYEAGDCPLCRKGIPAVKPGSRNLK